MEYHPHACFVGGGDFEDGVDNLFESNTLHVCAFETLDAGERPRLRRLLRPLIPAMLSGGFYSSGQHGSAFTNRGNTLRGNSFSRILNTAAGTGVQQASVQALYLDDQMSAWTVTDNHFTDCHVCSFIGGGRRNVVANNRFVRCGTVQYFNNQGMAGQFDHGTVNCSDVAPPFNTTCNTGAARWMATRSPAAAEWARRWPEMLRIDEEYPGTPAFNLCAPLRPALCCVARPARCGSHCAAGLA